MFSPMKRPEINPVWSSFIIYGKMCLSLSAMHADANLYDVFSKYIGLQFFKYNLSLFPLGKHVITPRFKDSDSTPLEKHPLIALSKNCPTSFQKNLKKKSYIKPSNPGLVLFDDF